LTAGPRVGSASGYGVVVAAAAVNLEY